MSFLCPMLVGRKFPWKTYNVSKRSRLTGLSQANQQDEDVYQRSGYGQDKNEEGNKDLSASKLELANLLAGASLERPAGIKAVVLWNYVPSHATDIRAWKGDIVNVFYRNGEWLFVENCSGAQGFIPFSFCSLTKRSRVDSTQNVKTLESHKTEQLRVFENEREVPSVIEYKNKKRDRTKDGLVRTDCVKKEEMDSRGSKADHKLVEAREEPSREDCKNGISDLRHSLSEGKCNYFEENETANKLSSACDDDISTLKSEKLSLSNYNGQTKGIDLRTLKTQTKTSESSTNETSSVQSDNSDKRKGRGFLSRRLKKEKKLRKEEKKKKEQRNGTGPHTKSQGGMPSLDPYGLDLWDWYLNETDTSSDSSDEEIFYTGKVRKKRKSKTTIRSEEIVQEEAFVTGTALPPKNSTAYALAQQILSQRDTFLVACDDIMISARDTKGPGGNATKTRHLSMLLDDEGPVNVINNSRSQDFSSGFAQVRKLQTSTRFDEFDEQLARLQVKELCVPKPKCLIEDDGIDIGFPGKGSSVGSRGDHSDELYEEQLDEELMLVVEDFEAENAEEVTVIAGERVFVCNACEHEEWWWVTTMEGREGFMPKSHLLPVVNDSDVAQMQSQCKEIPPYDDAAEVHNAIEPTGEDGTSSSKGAEDSNAPNNDVENLRNSSLFPRSLPLSDRNDTSAPEKGNDNSPSGRSPPKMAMVAPTLRPDILPSSYNSNRDEVTKPGKSFEDSDALNDLSLFDKAGDSLKFHSYENINSELFLDSVRKHLQLIDTYDINVEQERENLESCNDYRHVDYTDDGNDPAWVSRYLERYTNRLNRPLDDRPRALRRRDTIASTRPTGKRVRFHSSPGLHGDGSNNDDPVVVVHRYEVDDQENEEANPSKFILKGFSHGEMELATWC